MKLKEVVAMLNEYSKVVGEDCETDISDIRVIGRIERSYDGYQSYHNRKEGPRYCIRVQPDQPVIPYAPPTEPV